MFNKNQLARPPCFTKRCRRGLTLVETTIALGILMVGTLASLTLMISSFNYTQQTEHEIVVVNLAREGIEIMRALRNNRSIDLFTDNDGDYIVDVTDNFDLDNDVDDTDINNCTNCQLYLNSGRYTHDNTGTITFFKRRVTIENTAQAYEKRIVSEVSWTVKGKTYNYVLVTHLTNWQ